MKALHTTVQWIYSCACIDVSLFLFLPNISKLFRWFLWFPQERTHNFALEDGALIQFLPASLTGFSIHNCRRCTRPIKHRRHPTFLKNCRVVVGHVAAFYCHREGNASYQSLFVPITSNTSAVLLPKRRTIDGKPISAGQPFNSVNFNQPRRQTQRCGMNIMK